MKKYVTWKQVENFIDEVETLFKDKCVSGVYGLPRGGLVLATMISYRLDIPLLMSPNKNCIIVDDICDSGESLVHYFKNTSGEFRNPYYIVTMYYKGNKLGVVPDYWMVEKNNDWIVYPWEEKEPVNGLMG